MGLVPLSWADFDARRDLVCLDDPLRPVESLLGELLHVCLPYRVVHDGIVIRMLGFGLTRDIFRQFAVLHGCSWPGNHTCSSLSMSFVVYSRISGSVLCSCLARI